MITFSSFNNSLLLLYNDLSFSIMIFLIIQCLCVFVLNVDSNPVLYDQRQTGETNVNIEMKDVVFIAMSDGELGGDVSTPRMRCKYI